MSRNRDIYGENGPRKIMGICSSNDVTGTAFPPQCNMKITRRQYDRYKPPGTLYAIKLGETALSDAGRVQSFGYMRRGRPKCFYSFILFNCNVREY